MNYAAAIIVAFGIAWIAKTALDARVYREAILKHMRAEGNDRCWENDAELYRVVGGNFDPKLPTKCEFMRNCELYYDQQSCSAPRRGDSRGE